MKQKRKLHNHPNIASHIAPAYHAMNSSSGYYMYINNLPGEFYKAARNQLPAAIVATTTACHLGEGDMYVRWELHDQNNRLLGFITPRRAGMAVWLRGDSWDEPRPIFTTLFQAALYAAKRIKYEGLNHA